MKLLIPVCEGVKLMPKFIICLGQASVSGCLLDDDK